MNRNAPVFLRWPDNWIVLRIWLRSRFSFSVLIGRLIADLIILTTSLVARQCSRFSLLWRLAVCYSLSKLASTCLFSFVLVGPSVRSSPLLLFGVDHSNCLLEIINVLLLGKLPNQGDDWLAFVFGGGASKMGSQLRLSVILIREPGTYLTLKPNGRSCICHLVNRLLYS